MSEVKNNAITSDIDISEDSHAFARMRKAVAGYMPELQAMRGLAILAVLFHNVNPTGEATSGVYIFGLYVLGSNMGWLGVQLFFVLSGFLITGILLDGKGSEHQVYHFYMRRVLRIFPVYYVFLAFMFFVLPLLSVLPEWLENASTHQYIYWFYVMNWGSPFVNDTGLSHLWSLAIEEQFYLLWPLLVLQTNTRNLLYTCLAVIGSALVFRAAVTYYDYEFAKHAAYTFTFARWDALAAGGLLAIAIRTGTGYHWLRTWAMRVTWVLGILVLIQIGVNHNFSPVAKGMGVLNQTMAAVLFALFMYIAIDPLVRGKSLLKLLLNRPLQIIGKYSYAIYIFHLPVLLYWSSKFYLKGGVGPWWELIFISLYNVLGVFLISFALAFISWYLLEKPFLNLKRYFARNQAPDLSAQKP
jgi:peptidoglycan/LPS O-acetylase OafA/YrhL